MIQSVLLLTLLLPASSDRPGEDTRAVFKGLAADGTVLFGDRPSAVAPPGFRAAGRLSLPPANIIAPAATVRAGHPPDAPAPALKRRQAGAADAPGVALPDSQTCQRMRTRLASLWQERRQGYAAPRGQELKREIRRLQSAMKAHCGNWR